MAGVGAVGIGCCLELTMDQIFIILAVVRLQPNKKMCIGWYLEAMGSEPRDVIQRLGRLAVRVVELL